METGKFTNGQLYEASRLVMNVESVISQRVQGFKNIAERTTLPLEEQDRQLEMAVVWEQNFSDFDAMAKRLEPEQEKIDETERPKRDEKLINTINIRPLKPNDIANIEIIKRTARKIVPKSKMGRFMDRLAISLELGKTLGS